MKTIDTAQRKRIFGLTKAAYERSGCSLSLDGFRHEQMDALGIESLSDCPAAMGLKLMNRLHRMIEPQNIEQGMSNAEGKPTSTFCGSEFDVRHSAKRGPAGGRPKGIMEWSGAQYAQMTKVEALLTDMRLPWDYADSIAKRMFGASVLRVDTLNGKQLRSVIAALMKRQMKTGGRRTENSRGKS